VADLRPVQTFAHVWTVGRKTVSGGLKHNGVIRADRPRKPQGTGLTPVFDAGMPTKPRFRLTSHSTGLLLGKSAPVCSPRYYSFRVCTLEPFRDVDHGSDHVKNDPVPSQNALEDGPTSFRTGTDNEVVDLVVPADARGDRSQWPQRRAEPLPKRVERTTLEHEDAVQARASRRGFRNAPGLVTALDSNDQARVADVFER
jgi:hypothetical protein